MWLDWYLDTIDVKVSQNLKKITNISVVRSRIEVGPFVIALHWHISQHNNFYLTKYVEAYEARYMHRRQRSFCGARKTYTKPSTFVKYVIKFVHPSHCLLPRANQALLQEVWNLLQKDLISGGAVVQFWTSVQTWTSLNLTKVRFKVQAMAGTERGVQSKVQP